MKQTCWLLVLVVMIWGTACTHDVSGRKPLKQPILLWHAWNERETKVLNELLARFATIYPENVVIQQGFSAEELLAQFRQQAQRGLGPDLVIINGRALRELAHAGLIQDLSPYAIDTSVYLSTALQTLRYQDRLYGLPLSLHTIALYYNKNLITEPPTTLTALLEQAADSHSIALNTSFYGAFWGIQSFGSDVFDRTGRVVLDQGGFANWLAWLKKAQNLPNIILSNDPKTLEALFVQGRVACYAAGSDRLFDLQQALGEAAVGVSPLPEGPHNPSGPMLETETLLFNAASSRQQTERALRLAQFLTTIEQQTALIRQAGRVPANSRVWVDSRIYPAVAGFAAQARTAVALPNLPQIVDLQELGNDAYIQTLSGVLAPQQAAANLTQQVNAAYHLAASDPLTPTACNLSGTLQVWYIPHELDSAVLEAIREAFQQQCPAVTIHLTALTFDEQERDYDSRIHEQYQAAVAQGRAPDLLIGTNHLTAMLAAEGVLQEMSSLIEPEFLQRYLPEALDAMRYEGALYALPVSIIQLMALYYNADLVTDPPLMLEDLLHQADAGKKAVFPLNNFYAAYWGLPAFGAQLFDADYRVILDRGGFVEWLKWLQNAQKHPNLSLLLTDADADNAKTLFTHGDVAYLAGEARQLSELQAALGKKRVQVTPLPAGPQGKSGPVLGVQGVMLTRSLAPAQQALALAFARHLADRESQTLLMERANQVPAIVTVDTTAYPAIAGFMEQSRTASAPPIVPQVEPLFFWGSDPYLNVLEHGFSAKTAAAGFTNLVNKVNGVLPSPSKSPVSCEHAGPLVLWHSWPEMKAAALQRIMLQWTAACPENTLEFHFVSAADLLPRLSAAIREGTRPDLIVTSHQLLGDFMRGNLVQDLRPFVNEATLIQYRPGTLNAFMDAKRLYGLPLACRVMGLYYNPALVSSPAVAVDDLLTVPAPSYTMALDTSFSGAFWGISAFGGTVIGESGGINIDENGLIRWLTWLQAAKQRSNVILQPDPTEVLKTFMAGNTAYMAADSDVLTTIRNTLPAGQIGVTMLPAGPEGAQPTPFFQIDAFFVPTGIDEERTQRAVACAVFATSDASQTALMNNIALVPTNQLTDVAIKDSALASFSVMVDYSILMPDITTMSALTASGDTVYHDVLVGGKSPGEAVRQFMSVLQRPHP